MGRYITHEYDHPVARLSYEEACAGSEVPPLSVAEGRAMVTGAGSVLRLWVKRRDEVVYCRTRILSGSMSIPEEAEQWKIELEEAAARGAPIATSPWMERTG